MNKNASACADCQLREIDREEWNRHWPSVRHANLLQSWEYGDAKAMAEGWRAVRFLIEEEPGVPIAIAQVLARAWPIIGGVARLNRGPLLLLDADPNSPQAADRALRALSTLLAEGRRRRWWLFYAAPELEADEAIRPRLGAMGLKFRKLAPWASARLSLLPSEDALLANLNGKWRNLLRKAQKSGLVVERCNGSDPRLETLIDRYQQMQREKGFSGVSEALLRALAQQVGPDWRFNLYLTRSEVDVSPSGQWAGMLVSVIHGDTATYMVGYTDDIGRKLNANYLMLWQAIIDARETGCRWFDLGGLNENTPSGVAHFKLGVRGDGYGLTGEYGMFF